MRLSLAVPEGWEKQQGPNEQYLAICHGSDGNPELVMTYGGLVLLPDEQAPWIERAARSDAEVGAIIKLGPPSSGETTDGWPMQMVEAQVLAPKTEQLLEVRLCVFYAFLEHAAVCIVRAPSPSLFEKHRETLIAMMKSGRPDWKRSGQPACLDDFWDLGNDRESQQAVPVPSITSGALAVSTEADLTATLSRLDHELEIQATAELYIARGRVLLQLNRLDDAISSFQSALVRASENLHRAEAQRLLGTALASVGRDAEAKAHWQAALTANPDDADARYNLAQAQYNEKEYALALDNWQKVSAQEPDDFLTLRKVVQALHALERYDEAESVRQKLRSLWRASNDPRARLLHEYVIDQFSIGSLAVHAIETVCPKNPNFYSVYSFRVLDSHGHAIPYEVLLETSEYARQAGVPYVFGVLSDGRFKSLHTTVELPSYAELKRLATKFIQEAGLTDAATHQA